MNAQLDSSITASFLESGQMLANTGNAGAMVAGIAGVTAHSGFARLLAIGSMLCWLIQCWFAVRVKIDASLFRQLAGQSERSWRRLDELLMEWGFPRTSEDGSLGDRKRGAMTLWRSQAVALAIQLAILAGAVLFEVNGV
jgi:hypothetical protein